MKVEIKYVPREDEIGIIASRRRKMRYFMAVARELSVKMVCCSILSFIVLKLKEESRRI